MRKWMMNRGGDACVNIYRVAAISQETSQPCLRAFRKPHLSFKGLARAYEILRNFLYSKRKGGKYGNEFLRAIKTQHRTKGVLPKASPAS